MADFEPDDLPWTEEHWERFMQRSDARSARFGDLLETLRNHPDRDEIVAREMGWGHMSRMVGIAPVGLLRRSVFDRQRVGYALAYLFPGSEEHDGMLKHNLQG